MSSRQAAHRSLTTPAIVPATRQARAIVTALLVPAAVTLMGLLPWLLLPHIDGHDRALVWITGSDAAIRGAMARVAAEPAFSGAATTATVASARPGVSAVRTPGTLPANCPENAIRLHFDIARIDEAQVAREALEGIAVDAGAMICASHLFELNRVDAPSTLWLPLAASLLLPSALLLAMRLATPSRTPFKPTAACRARHANAWLLAGVAATCLLPIPGGSDLVGVGTPPLLSITTLSMALLPPAVHEAAFRDWMLPRLAAVAGPGCAAGLSLVASVVAAVPFADATGVATTALAAAAACAMFLRTGSLRACLGAHLLAAVAARTLATLVG